MRRTSLWILALALVAGACDSESGPSVAKLEDMRVVKVSGDQSSPVPSAPSTTIYATAGASLDVIGADGYTPEPLVARVEVQGSGSMGIMSGGPVVPKGTMIHWQLPTEAGKLFGGTTATDDSAHVINRYAPGVKAGTYLAQAGRMVGTEIVIDAEWELVVLPGPVVTVQWNSQAVPRQVGAGSVLDFGGAVQGGRDAHGNRLESAVVLATVEAGSAWGPLHVSGGGICRNYPEAPQQTGWTTTPPAEASGWAPVGAEGHNACLWLWAGDMLNEYPVRVTP